MKPQIVKVPQVKRGEKNRLKGECVPSVCYENKVSFQKVYSVFSTKLLFAN